MDVFADYATDEAKEIDGAWHTLAPGAEILVARSGNRKYARKLAVEVEKHQHVLDAAGDDSDKLSDQIMIDVMAETILLGWRGDNFKYKGAVYTCPEDAAKRKEAAKLLLSVKDFRQRVAKLSNDFDAYRVKQEAETVKN